MIRVHRTFAQRLFYRSIVRCSKCGRLERAAKRLLSFSLTSRCPRCHGYKLYKLHKVDPIETMYKNPFSYIQKWFGGNLHWCPFCRVQFYDMRKARYARAASGK